MAAHQKIKNLTELGEILGKARQEGKRTVLCHGVFDLMHPGHILHIAAARKQGDVLAVTITPDRFVRKGPGRPVFSEKLRIQTVASLQDVDYTALNEWPTAVETIARLKPHVYAKGNDYTNPADDLTGRIVDEENAVRSIGGEIFFTNEESFSSSRLINQFFSTYPPQTEKYLKSFRSRYSADQVIDCVRGLQDLKVLLVGEAILDQYRYCTPMGKSPKETIVSTRFENEEIFAGGSLAIANHLAGFCKEVTLITMLGENTDQRRFIDSKLRPNVQLKAVVMKDRPTITKRRYLEPNFLTKMFEVQYLDDRPVPDAVEKDIRSRLEKCLEGHDFLVTADFGHGLMTKALREFVSSHGKFLALNTQSNSANLGFNTVTNYQRANFVCIDEPELKLAAARQYGDLHRLTDEVRRRIQVDAFLVSRGPLGSLIFSDHEPVVHTPALATRVVDRTGAGDALFSIASPCVYKKYPVEVVGFLGNCVGALAVEIVCNRDPVDPTLLLKFIKSVLM
ncbi:MAG: adenylyltransferase/cytidyltransferase family protein [Candidatus Omnitrophica bacterium]|nr:adenylyltransferase/cytidyltransferase family protein [Candidatus Omnitrophota bacterium]